MHIGNKLFPYPTLNNNPGLSDYVNSSTFEFKIKLSEDGSILEDSENIILKNACFELKNRELIQLFLQGKIKTALIVESSASIFRRSYDITHTPKDIVIAKSDLKDSVSVSSYIYAVEDILNFKNEDFLEDYIEYSFDIEKYDILAIDDGFKFNINIDSSEDDKLSSIFTIVKNESMTQQMSYESTSNKINIYLSEEHYNYYGSMKQLPQYNNIIFSMIVMPALVGSLYEIKLNINEYSEITDIIEQKKWFNSICIRYEKMTRNKLTKDELEEIDTFQLAQIVLNNATCNGIKEFESLLFEKNKEESEDDD